MPMRRSRPIDFVLPDDDKAARGSYDQAMHAPIRKPAAPQPQGCTGDCRQGRNCTCAEAETSSEFSADLIAADASFWIWSALMWTFIWFYLGFICARHFS